MPMYLITDTQTPDRALVSAANPAQAKRLYLGDRLGISEALEVDQAVRLATHGGVRVISQAEDVEDANQAALPFSQTEDAKAFTAGMEDCDVAAGDAA